MSKPGHNSRAKAGPVNAERLKSFIERIEKLEEERKAIGGDIKDVYAEAKDIGYDVKTMRKIVALRSMDAADRAEAETLLDVYCHALGMDTIGYGGAPREPSEEELEALAGRIVAEVDRCMDLVGDGNQLPTIRAIQDAIGCSTGKASKLRGMVQERISRSGAVQREMKSPHDADGVVTETQDAASQGDYSTPMAPQAVGVAASSVTPDTQGEVGTGTHSQTQESCGGAGSASATHNSHHVGHAEGAVAAPPASPHDTIIQTQDKGDGQKGSAASSVAGPVLRAKTSQENGVSNGVSRGVTNASESSAGCSENGSHKDEAPATPSVGAEASASERVAPNNPDDDDLAIPPFLIRAQAGRGAA